MTPEHYLFLAALRVSSKPWRERRAIERELAAAIRMLRWHAAEARG